MYTNMFADNCAKKPNTDTYFNKTKCGVHVADLMIKKYTTKCVTRRLSVHVLFNVIYTASINAWINFKESSNISISV